LAAEIAHLLHHCRVDQLDADGQAVQVRVGFFHQVPIQLIGRIVAPDQRPDHVRRYAAVMVMLVMVLVLLMMVTASAAGDRRLVAV